MFTLRSLCLGHDRGFSAHLTRSAKRSNSVSVMRPPLGECSQRSKRMSQTSVCLPRHVQDNSSLRRLRTSRISVDHFSFVRLCSIENNA